jgi:DNA processing protein
MSPLQTPANDAERLAWLRLSRTENVGPITFKKLIARYGSASAALEAIPEIAQRRGKRSFKIYPLAAAEKEFDAAKKLGAHILCLGEDTYPTLLSHIDDAPPILMVRGRLDLLAKPGIAIVGARNASLPGRRMAEVLSKDLAANYNIVSGLARGIDTAAHASALNAQGGTIAVLAGGVDVIYPLENEKLYADIADRGAIIAENPPGYPPTNRDFPRRNRIIAGLSLGVIIVEAALKSGSLITAEYALQQGREVMAVPGSPMDPRAQGTNRLIKDGAALVENAQDVLRHIVARAAAPKNFMDQISNDDALSETTGEFSGQQFDANYIARLSEQVLSDISYAPVAIHDLLDATGAGVVPDQWSGTAVAAALQTAILELELTGEVQRLPGNRVVRVALDEGKADLSS